MLNMINFILFQQVEASEKSNLVVISEGCSEMLEESNGKPIDNNGMSLKM